MARVEVDLTIAEAIEVRRALRLFRHETARRPEWSRSRGIMTRAEQKITSRLIRLNVEASDG